MSGSVPPKSEKKIIIKKSLTSIDNMEVIVEWRDGSGGTYMVLRRKCQMKYPKTAKKTAAVI